MEFRKRFLGDIVGIILILVLISLFILGTLVIFNVPERTPGSVKNEGPAGVSLFAEWLQERGYQIRTLQNDTSFVRGNDAMLLVLAPRSGFSRNDLTRMERWVQLGGTLIIAQDGRQPSKLPGKFGLGIGRLWRPVNKSSLALPTLNWPPVGQAEIEAAHYISNACGRAAVHMGTCQRPLLVGLGHGLGRVFVISTVHPFTNAGIENAGNARLVENIILSIARPGQVIVFDEYHHQIQLTWLFTTPTGVAFWLCLLAIFGFLIWSNSNMPTGRAKNAKPQSRIIGPVAKSVNNLEEAQQQFARPEAIKQHYWLRVKRVLARRYGVDPQQVDTDFMESLKPFVDQVDLGTVVYLFSYKDKFPPMNENELRQWVSVAIDLSDSHDLSKSQQFSEISGWSM